MLTSSKEHAGIFFPLPASGYSQLAEDDELRNHYLDLITYMHDLVAPYWDHPEPARFEVEDAVINMNVLIDRHFSEGDSLSEHVQENVETSQYFGKQGLVSEGTNRGSETLRRRATLFIKGLLFTYNQVRAI